MSKSNTFETELLNLIFNNQNIPNIGDATGLRGSSTAGSLYVALHTADPGEAGDQTTNECNYTGYARKAIARGQFTVANNQATNTNQVDFDPCTGGSNTAQWFSFGVAVSGSSKIIYRGQITNPSGGLAISNGITPRFAAGMAAITED